MQQQAENRADTESPSSVLQVYEGPDHVNVTVSPDVIVEELVGYEIDTSRACRNSQDDEFQ